MPNAVHLLAQRAHLECELGEFGDAEIRLDRLLEAQSLFSPGPIMEFAVPAVVIPVVARSTGRVDRLDSVKQSAESVLASDHALPFHEMQARAGLAIQAVQQRDLAVSMEQYTALKSQSGTMVSLLFLCTDRLLGLLSMTANELGQAMDHFEDALAFCRKAGYRPELAWSCYEYADTLLQRNEPGDREKAKSLLDESLAISTELGMRPLMERVIFLRDILKA